APHSITNMKGDKGQYFDEFCVINREFQKLGNTLMALDSKLVLHSADLLTERLDTYKEGLPTDTVSDSEILDGELPQRTSVGELHDEYGNKYLLILNRDYEKDVFFTLSLKNDSRLYLVDRTSGRQKLIKEGTKEIFCHLKAGDATLIRVQDMKEEAFTIEYRLDK
ncbi:MAG: hypothetical protein J6E38_07825, partial [Clostridia bacterium]|nr:hypothetical protein [Clostridia bacterium]